MRSAGILPGQPGPRATVALGMFLVLLYIPSPGRTQGYISTKRVAAIGVGSVGLAAVGQLALRIDSTRNPLIRGPLPFEQSLQRLVGGEFRVGKTNFLDHSRGSAYTPVAAGLLLFAADLSWPQGERDKTTAQDMYLYGTGLLATKGLTSLAKGLVARQRPSLYLADKPPPTDETRGFAYSNHAFFSGHASSAFFAATFVNKRIRSVMRANMSCHSFKSWRWAPPLLLYGCASFVGWSRIHAYKHFPSDVVAGALAGCLMAELFHSLGDDFYSGQGTGNNPVTFKIAIAF